MARAARCQRLSKSTNSLLPSAKGPKRSQSPNGSTIASDLVTSEEGSTKEANNPTSLPPRSRRKKERKDKMEQNQTVQAIVSLGGGLVTDVQVFRSKQSAHTFWDESIEKAKKHVKYDTLSPEEQGEFDQDPFGFAYDGDIDLIWEETTLKD